LAGAGICVTDFSRDRSAVWAGPRDPFLEGRTCGYDARRLARLGLQREGGAHARRTDGVAAGFGGSADGRRGAPIGNVARFVAAESGLQSIASGDGEYLSAKPE